MMTYYKYSKLIEVIERGDKLVHWAIVEYYILSMKSKRVCVDIRRLVILPTLTELTDTSVG